MHWLGGLESTYAALVKCCEPPHQLISGFNSEVDGPGLCAFLIPL